MLSRISFHFHKRTVASIFGKSRGCFAPRHFWSKPSKEDPTFQDEGVHPKVRDTDRFDLDLGEGGRVEDRVKKITLPKAIVKEVDENAELEKTERGQIVRERRVMLKEYDHFVKEQKYGSFMIVAGITFFIMGTWSLMVPLYKLVWERYGFSTKTHAESYKTAETVNDVLKKWIVKFEGAVEDDLPWNFEPETKRVMVNAGETALVFFKAYNNSDKPIVGLSIYQVDPNEASLYFNKVQCFWFENQLLHPKEYVDLPVFFYIDPLINRDPAVMEQQELTVTYHFFPASDQTIAQVVQRELEKHEKEQEVLKQKRLDYGVTEEEKQGRQDDFSALPGMSPRRRSERALRQMKVAQSLLKDDDDDLEVIIDRSPDPKDNDNDSGILDQSIFTNSFDDIQLPNVNLHATSEH